ncbi:DNA alkylation repair protein [Caenimonas terrae]|uniref:DNA alkylation repair protein n=1 Tax=Caenimonas terrae TaxID=696074 RepID=A0ABW0N5R7_9BURK
MAGSEAPRKGAARIALIPPAVLAALNRGELATANLNEFLALDLAVLASSVAQRIGLDPRSERIADTLAMLPAFRPVARHLHVARALYDLASGHADRDRVAYALATHPSDVARTWAAQWVGFSGLPLPDKLASVRRFAADPHFGVRETAWMAVRDEVVRDSARAIELLLPWVADADPNIRRFASELTRPRGVWCAPVPALRTGPWLAIDLLEPLRADPSRYVQNSVANWLNDASKSQPQWVQRTCDRWSAASSSPATAYIVRRALRTLRGMP